MQFPSLALPSFTGSALVKMSFCSSVLGNGFSLGLSSEVPGRDFDLWPIS